MNKVVPKGDIWRCLFICTYSDIDECALGLHECHLSTSCVNTVGSYNCSCDHNTGYFYNGSGMFR